MSSDSAAGSSAGVLAPYDAVLVLSFGGPNESADVLPFLRDVVSGKGVPDKRLEQVAHHYELFGGRSPINGENLRLVSDLSAEFERRGERVPVLFGNLHWQPRTVDTLRTALAYGARRVLTLITSAYASYSGSRQYREHLADALARLRAEGLSGAEELQVDVLRPFFNHPGFVTANEHAVRDAVRALGEDAGSGERPVHIAYVTHSIPLTMNAASGATGPSYLEQHREVRRLLDERLGADLAFESSLSFCSRSGDPSTPWLEPDVNETLEQIHADGVRDVVVAPIGFVSDHMEVVYDLDTEARETADRLGLNMRRSGTAGRRPEFVSGVADLVLERAARERGERTGAAVVGRLDAFPDDAPAGSCRQKDGVVTGIPVIAGSAD